MSKKERKARHLAAARLLEESGPDEDEIVEVLASHYVEAFNAAPDAPDAVEIKAKAREALEQAGRRAASLAAAVEALRYFEQAIELAEDPRVVAHLREQAGQMCFFMGDLKRTRAHLDEARELFGSLGDLRGAARAAAIMGSALRPEGRLEEAVELMEPALGVLADEEPDESVAILAAELGRALLFLGHREAAFDRIEQALTIAERLQAPRALSEAMDTKALVLLSFSRPEEATLLLQHSLDIALEHNLGEAAARALNNLGAFMNERDEHEAELEYGSRSVELARKLGNRPWLEVTSLGIVSPLLFLGRWDEAIQSFEEAKQVGGDAFGTRGAAELPTIGFVFVYRGEIEKARGVLALSMSAESEDIQARAAWHTLNAMLCRVEGKFADAWASATVVFELRAELGDRSPSTKDAIVELCETGFATKDLDKVNEVLDVVRVWQPGELTPYTRAQVQRFEARLKVARDLDPTEDFDSVRRAFDKMSMPFWKAVVSTELAEWLLDQGRDGEAAPLVMDARATFEHLRATPWLERLDKSGAMETLAQAT